MGQWATVPMNRRQTMLFCPTLDEAVSQDHPVRLFDEILAAMDWSPWENHYVQVAGQPPIHPRIVAGAILYGLSHGMRSSRRLEWACKNAVDFIWLTQGTQMDHSTFCNFRTRFAMELKGLFRQIGRLAMRMGMIRLNQIALDGTRVKANSSRHATASAGTLESRLSALDEQIERMMDEIDGQDETDLFGQSISSNHLPAELAELKRRQHRLSKALTMARNATSAKGCDDDSPKAPKVPVADPDSSVQPNKEGGYSPNYTPVNTVDSHKGFIIDTEVPEDHDEAKMTVATVDRVEKDFGQKPQQLLADSAHNSGKTLSQLQRREVEAYIPLSQRPHGEDNPAMRSNVRQPIPRSDWSKLPRNSRTKKLDRAAFVYDSSSDCYYCPMGHELKFVGIQNKTQRKWKVKYRLYRCTSCRSCPLADQCVGSKSGIRTVSRDEHEPLRETMEVRMNSPSGKQIYSRRKWIAETPFAFIKSWMNFRQFLLRGLEKVRTEWLWACTSYNLTKLVREITKLRSRFAILIG